MARIRSASGSAPRSRPGTGAVDAPRPAAAPGAVAVLVHAGEERLRPLLSALADRKGKLVLPA